jgi:hypothetical protein
MPPVGRGRAKGKEMSVVASRRWTAEEDEKLRSLAMSGRTVAQIAKELKRTEAAIRGRVYKLEILVGSASSVPQWPRGH